MASAVDHKIVTYEEWLNMPEVSEGREEVVNGEIIHMPPSKSPHAEIVANLTEEFNSQSKRRFWVLTGSFGLVIRKEPVTTRNPDLVVFDRATRTEEDGYYHVPPGLAVEVLSPSETRRMTEAKLRDYEAIGVPEVWVISPEAATVEVLLLEEGQLRRSAILAEGKLKPGHLPGVEIEIAAIWPE